MRGHLIVPAVLVSPGEECLVEPPKIDRWVRLPPRFVKIVVQDNHAASWLRGLLHVANRALRLTDPLDRAGGGNDVEPVDEPIAWRQNIHRLKAQVFDCSILLNGAHKV